MWEFVLGSVQVAALCCTDLDFQLTLGWLHVYIATFSVLIHHYCVCVCFVVFGSAPTLLVQVYWASGVALGVPTLCVKSQFNILQNGWFGTMVHEPFGSRYNGTQTAWFSARWCSNHCVLAWFVLFLLDLPLLDVSCLSLLYLSLLGLSLPYCFCMFCMFCMFCIVLLGG